MCQKTKKTVKIRSKKFVIAESEFKIIAIKEWNIA